MFLGEGEVQSRPWSGEKDELAKIKDLRKQSWKTHLNTVIPLTEKELEIYKNKLLRNEQALQKNPKDKSEFNKRIAHYKQVISNLTKRVSDLRLQLQKIG